MNRRSGLGILLGRSNSSKKTMPSAPPVVSSLVPYTGDWNFAQAAHLLRRTIFGPTPTQIKDAATAGMNATVDQLLEINPMPDPPVHFSFRDDPHAAIGETWVGQPHDRTIPNLNTARSVSLNGWLVGLMNEGGVSIREKLVLFWHNHFVTSAIELAAYNYDYFDILRRNSLGNFRTMTEEITVCPSMLVYLNGNENTREAPNENFSRELLELFTIGKGDAVGPGDYTNYTEDDVIQMARALTGWQSGRRDGTIGSTYVNQRHDRSNKQLSYRFDNAIINNENGEEYKTVIDIILQQDETARYISRRLHIWLVGSNIDADVETNVIEAMAALIRDNNYEIKPALEALLKSEYFYQESIRGCMVNHPIDFLFKMVNGLELSIPGGFSEKYQTWVQIFRVSQLLEMEIMAIPSVAGWKAFYQSPQYYDTWANSVSLPQRENITNLLIDGVTVNRINLKIDVLAVVEKLDDPYDPNNLINELTETFFPFPVSQEQLDFLKDVLIAGLPDFEWTVEYSDYTGDPNDPDKRAGVVTKLEGLFKAMLKMPEFYLI